MQRIDIFLNAKEFGQDLFEAIRLCGGVEHMRQIREQSKMRTVKPGQLTAWLNRERELIQELLVVVAKLTDNDAGDLARRFRWVAQL